MGGGERTVLLGPVVADRMDPHDGAWKASCTEEATMATCNVLPAQARPARYIVPAKETDPLWSATRVTIGPAVGRRAPRLACTGGAEDPSGLRRCGWEATSTSRW